MPLLILAKDIHFSVQNKDPGNSRLRHRYAVNTPRIINLNPMIMHILHRHPVIASTGQLNEPQTRKIFNCMIQKQTIAYHSLNLIRRAWQLVLLKLQKMNTMAFFFKISHMQFCTRKCTCYKKFHYDPPRTGRSRLPI